MSKLQAIAGACVLSFLAGGPEVRDRDASEVPVHFGLELLLHPRQGAPWSESSVLESGAPVVERSVMPDSEYSPDIIGHLDALRSLIQEREGFEERRAQQELRLRGQLQVASDNRALSGEGYWGSRERTVDSANISRSREALEELEGQINAWQEGWNLVHQRLRHACEALSVSYDDVCAEQNVSAERFEKKDGAHDENGLKENEETR